MRFLFQSLFIVWIFFLSSFYFQTVSAKTGQCLSEKLSLIQENSAHGPDAEISRSAAYHRIKKDGGIPSGQAPTQVKIVTMQTPAGKPMIGENGLPIKTREYHFNLPDGRKIVIQEHSLGHSFGEGGLVIKAPILMYVTSIL